MVSQQSHSSEPARPSQAAGGTSRKVLTASWTACPTSSAVTGSKPSEVPRSPGVMARASVSPVTSRRRRAGRDADHGLQPPAARLDDRSRAGVVVVTDQQHPPDPRPRDDQALPEDLRGVPGAAELRQHAVADMAAFTSQKIIESVPDG